MFSGRQGGLPQRFHNNNTNHRHPPQNQKYRPQRLRYLCERLRMPVLLPREYERCKRCGACLYSYADTRKGAQRPVDVGFCADRSEAERKVSRGAAMSEAKSSKAAYQHINVNTGRCQSDSTQRFFRTTKSTANGSFPISS